MRKNDLQGASRLPGEVLYLGDIHAYEKRFLAVHTELKSWRDVAEPYDIHPSMARLIAKGHDPGTKIRAKLHLPAKQAVEVCTKCGVAHITKRCTNSNGKSRPPRIAIRLDNPDSAAASIKGHMDRDRINELVELLKGRKL